MGQIIVENSLLSTEISMLYFGLVKAAGCGVKDQGVETDVGWHVSILPE
jgi:hypothetical protein